jgi:hypothetical protein
LSRGRRQLSLLSLFDRSAATTPSVVGCTVTCV